MARRLRRRAATRKEPLVNTALVGSQRADLYIPRQVPSRRNTTWLAATALTALLLAPGCGPPRRALELAKCSLNSDCAKDLLCAFGKCRVPCVTSADCPAGGSCVTDMHNAVCLSAAEANAPCQMATDCPAPLACAADFRCRNLCDDDTDCNVFEVHGRVCAGDDRGAHYCADAPAPPDAGDGAVLATSVDAAVEAPPGDVPAERGIAVGVIGPSGGTFGTETVTVTIPPSALDREIALTIKAIDVPAPGAIGQVYELGPTGTQFRQSAVITFAYDDGVDPSTLAVGTFSAGAWRVVSRPIVDPFAKTIGGTTSHLSTYALVSTSANGAGGTSGSGSGMAGAGAGGAGIGGAGAAGTTGSGAAGTAAAGVAGTTGSGVAGTTGSGVAGTNGSGVAGTTGSGVAGTTGSGAAGTTGSGAAGTTGSGTAGTTGSGAAGTTGSGAAGTTGAGTAGSGGSGAAGTSGSGVAGTTGSGAAGAGSGAAGSTGTAGSGAAGTGAAGTGAAGTGAAGTGAAGTGAAGSSQALSAGCGLPPLGTDKATAFVKHDIMVSGVDPAFIAAYALNAGSQYSWTKRNYYLRLPTSYNVGQGYSVDLAATGCGGSETAGSSGDYSLPSTVPPSDAIQVGLSYNASSAATPSCNAFADDYVNSPEPAYINAVVDDIVSKYCVDKNKVFINGYSFGAFEALMAGGTNQDKVRGVGVQIGGGLRNMHPPFMASPVAAFFVVGTMDTGEPIGPLATAQNDSFGSALARDEILKRNGCVPSDFVFSTTDATGIGNAPNVPWDAAYPKCVTYSGCPAKYPVVWCPLDVNHGNGPMPMGPDSTVVDSYRRTGMWKFFQALPPP
jgi:hypothetical protein